MASQVLYASSPVVIAGNPQMTTWERRLLNAPLSDRVGGRHCDDRTVHQDHLAEQKGVKAACFPSTACGSRLPIFGTLEEAPSEDDVHCGMSSNNDTLLTSGLMLAQKVRQQGHTIYHEPVPIVRVCCSAAHSKDLPPRQARILKSVEIEHKSWSGYCFHGITEDMVSSVIASRRMRSEWGEIWSLQTGDDAPAKLYEAVPIPPAEGTLLKNGLVQEETALSSETESGKPGKAKGDVLCRTRVALLTDGFRSTGAMAAISDESLWADRFLCVVSQQGLRKSLLGRYVRWAYVDSTGSFSVSTLPPWQLGHRAELVTPGRKAGKSSCGYDYVDSGTRLTLSDEHTWLDGHDQLYREDVADDAATNW